MKNIRESIFLGRRLLSALICVLLLATTVTPMVASAITPVGHEPERPRIAETTNEKTITDDQRSSDRRASENAVEIAVEHTEGIIQISTHIHDFSLEKVNIRDTDYYRVVVGDESNIGEKGLPDLPNIRRSIIIPDTAKMAIRVTHADYEEYTDVLVAPSKGILSRSINPETVPYEFDTMYAEDTWFPKTLAELGQPYILRDFRGQVVTINPFQYNPYHHTLRVYTDIAVEVFSTGIDTENVILRSAPPSTVDLDFKQIYEHHFINSDPVLLYTPVEEQGNMLVITYDAFWDAMVPFVQWKNMKGVPTEMVNVSEFGSATAIYNHISDYYSTNGLTFVLLVGDIAQVPSIILGSHASDPSYSYMVGNDHYPDLFVGRFSAQTLAQAETQIERSIEYEKYPQTGADWYHEGTGIGSDEGIGDDGEYDWEHIRNIRTDLLGFTYTWVDEFYGGSQGGNDAPGNPSSTIIGNAFDDGRSFVNYCGHGAWDGWGWGSVSGWYVFDISDVNTLVNDNMLPFITSVACDTGQFDLYSTCFGEAWMRATHSGEPTGAIGFYGSTISQSWDPPMDAQDEIVDLLVAEAKNTFGGLCFNGAMHMNDEYGSAGWEETDHWTVFGDPSLQVRTDTPSELDVDHSPIILDGATTYELDVPGMENALCALSYEYTLLGSGYTDETGHAIITLDDPISEVEAVDLVVTAFNTVPYITSLTVVSKRQPAEFESMQGVLIRYPFGISYDIIAEMSENTEVVTIVANAGEESYVLSQYTSHGVHTDNCIFLHATTDSYWTRDYGPWFVYDVEGNQGVVDFQYNRPRPNDNAIPSAFASAYGLPLYDLGLIHTGGNYMTDGQGIAVSTDLVLTENPSLTIDDINAQMADVLGIRTYHVVPDVLGEYIEHIDCWAKFLAPDKILILEVPPGHSQYDEIEAAVDYFEGQISCYGTPYEIVRVYTPNGEPYTNSLILNNKTLVPITGSIWDDDALATYQAAMPGYEVLGFTGTWETTDALHCRAKGIPDRYMLYIEHTPLRDGFPADDGFKVEARIVPHSGAGLDPNATQVVWKADDGEWNPVQMEAVGNDYYEAFIPPLPSDTVVSYYVHAEDSSGRSENHPYIGAAGAHQFTVTPVPDIWVNPLAFTIKKPIDTTSVELFTIGNEEYAGETLTFDITWTDDSGYSWLSVSPAHGALLPGESLDVNVSINTYPLSPGVYQESILISSDDPDEPLLNVPVVLTVTFLNDVGVTAINAPPSLTQPGLHTINATVENFGSSNQTDVVVTCEISAGGGLPYSVDFEADNGGYTSGGTSLWEWGVPTSGPGSAHSGTKCWGTNLEGDYGNYENAYLDSQPIMLPIGIPAQLSFWHWYDTEGYYDGGNVKLSTNGGSTWSLLGSYLDPYPEDAAASGNAGIAGEPCFSGHGQGYWEEVAFDLSDYAGEEVIIRWHFGSDVSYTYDGWYIDDVMIDARGGRQMRTNGLVYSAQVNVTVEGYSTAFVEFTPQWDASPGSYGIIVKTMLPDDQDTSNDKKTQAVMVIAGNDTGVTAINYPTGNQSPGDYIVNVTVNNFGSLYHTTPVTCMIYNGTDDLVYTVNTTTAIPPLEDRYVEFTPAWHVAPSGTYHIIAMTTLPGDEYPANDANDTLVYIQPYTDVGIVSINAPPSEIYAGSHTVNATVENLGGEDQTTLLVNCSIYERYTGSYLVEDFSGVFPPTGWSQNETGEWKKQNSNNAGGTAPEAYLNWQSINGDHAGLDTVPIDTLLAVALKLQFKLYIDHFTSTFNCRVLTRANASDSWTDVTPWSNPIGGDVGPQMVTLDISSDIGSATQVRFEFSGPSWNIWGWSIDDVEIYSTASRGPGDLVYSDEETMLVPALSTATVEFTPPWTAAPGTYVVKVTTLLSGDEDSSNDQLNTAVTVEAGVILEGDCYYGSMEPADNVTVAVLNLDTGEIWQASTVDNHYSLHLDPTADISVGDTLRLIAKDDTESVNVTDHTIVQAEIDAGSISVDLVIDVHYRDLKQFPFYPAEHSGTLDTNQLCGAAVGQMMLNYLTWNSSQYLGGPPMTYDNQTWIFENATEHNDNTSLGYIDSGGMVRLLIREITAQDYGYHFFTSYNDTQDGIAMRICGWVDFDVEQHLSLKEGHPAHVPALIPAYGAYSQWMAVRGIHTNKNTDPFPNGPPDNIEVYGFWVNDPLPAGIGENTYKTVDEFFATYYSPLNVDDDPHNGEYVAITEPPEDFDDSLFDTTPLVFAASSVTFSEQDARIMKRAGRQAMQVSFVNDVAETVIFNAALNAITDLARIDNTLADKLADAQPVKGIYVRRDNAPNYCISVFSCNTGTIAVCINTKTGQLLEVSTSGELPAEYLIKLGIENTGGMAFAQYTQGSLFYPHVTR